MTKELFKIGTSFPATKSITFDNKIGGVDLLIHYSDKARLLPGLPNQIAQFEIAEGKIDKQGVEKVQFTMRITNCVHNVAILDDAELLYEYPEI